MRRGVCVGCGVGLSPRYNVVSTSRHYNVFNFIILLMFLLLNSIHSKAFSGTNAVDVMLTK